MDRIVLTKQGSIQVCTGPAWQVQRQAAALQAMGWRVIWA